jgi:hypothetical protein
MQTQSQQNPADLQDGLRTVRQFISGLSSSTIGDQSYANADALAVNQPYQYQTIGPGGQGASIEGSGVNIAVPGAAVSLSPIVLLALAGVAVYLLMK